MKATIKPTTAIHEAADKEATRYALNAVCVTPVDESTVWLSACNSRILACVKQAGTAIEPMLMPAAAAKTGKAFRDNGHWVDNKNTMHPIPDGRFPRCNEVIPDIGPREGFVTLRIDADLLAKLAHAINRPEKKYDSQVRGSVLLIVETCAKDGVAMPTDKPIGVIGSEGFGVIMPLGQDNETSESALRQYADLAKQYRTEFKNPETT